jgi:CO/xanthine dehydrogenase FAD-binding subunit
MKPAPFRYIAASSLDHALSLKAYHGDEARFLAGGQSLIPTMNFRLARPSVLIDINGLRDLAGVARAGSGDIRIGALTRYCDLERDPGFLSACPLFADALPHIAHPQIRNRGTIGGNLSHADPASEIPALAVAMQARMRLKSCKSEREVAASGFFQGSLTTDIEVDEMLIGIDLPAQVPRTGTCFMEVARRRGDFAIAGVAAMITLDGARRCTKIRLALCGVDETPVDASEAGACLVGQTVADDAIESVVAAVQSRIAPAGSVQASADYQRHVAGILTQRTIVSACERAYAA